MLTSIIIEQSRFVITPYSCLMKWIKNISSSQIVNLSDFCCISQKSLASCYFYVHTHNLRQQIVDGITSFYPNKQNYVYKDIAKAFM